MFQSEDWHRPLGTLILKFGAALKYKHIANMFGQNFILGDIRISKFVNVETNMCRTILETRLINS